MELMWTAIRSYVIAGVRTGAAMVVVWLVTVLAGIDINLEPELGAGLNAVLFALGIFTYNFIVNWLTDNVWSGFGYLLIVKTTPSYEATPK